MAVVEMTKYRLAVRKAVLEPVSDVLQRAGACEFRESSERRGGSLKGELDVRLRRAEDLLSEARFVQRFGLAYVSPGKGGMGRLLGDLPVLTLEDLQRSFDEERFVSVAEEFRGMERCLSEIRSDLSRISAAKTVLGPLAGVPYPLELFHSGTDLVFALIGTVPSPLVPSWEDSLRERTDGRAETRAFPAVEGQDVRLVCVLALRADEESVRSVCDASDFSRIDIPREWAGLPGQEIDRLDATASELREREARVVEEARRAAPEGVVLAERAFDLQSILKARVEAMQSGADTEQVHILTFWAPAEAEKAIRELLVPWTTSVDLASVEPEAGENPPTFLKNGGLFSPYEPLTLMYGAPTYDTVDPTSLMAPFFFVFFGMCLGDAGYGLIVAALLLFVSSRHKITGQARKFYLILMGGAVATIIAGALTGSWMGDMIDSFAFLEPIRPIKNFLKITDPMTDPMTYLGVSLALGFFQLIFGLCIAMGECLKRKDYLGAFADKGGWIIFLIGLAAFGLGKAGSLPAWTVTPSGAMAGAGALILFLTQGRDKPSLFGKALSGLLSLYNVTAYLGDTLSYSRLLALGLSSAAIGMIVNLLCNLVWDIPYVGVLIAVILFVGGHTFSVVISILGAFIHSLRLQYVEFFSKFYEGNGRSFDPLACRTQYVRLSASGGGNGKA